MHSQGREVESGKRAGGEDEFDAAAVRPGFDAKFRASVVGGSGLMLCVALCVLAAAGFDRGPGPRELEGVSVCRVVKVCLACTAVRLF